MPSFKHYETLGVEQGASKDEIKRAYKKLAMQHHPDKGGDPDKFKEISNAYQVLSDDQNRARYDQLGDDGFEMGGAGGFESVDPRHIFEQFFGGGMGMGGMGMGLHDIFHEFHHGRGAGPRGPVKRNDHAHPIKINLSDAYHGVTKHVRVSMQKMCMQCKETCNHCQGRGSITDMRRVGFFTQMMTRPCDPCSGTGIIFRGKDSCKNCSGKGHNQTEEKVEINIPRGVKNGHVIKLNGMGEQIQNEGEIPGDLLLQILIHEDAHFQRNDNDLIFKAPISFAESVIGKKITIPHFAGDFEIDVADFGIVKPDRPYTLESKGMPCDSHGSHFGKLFIVFQINYPSKKWNVEERTKMETVFREVGLII